ncbi:MAG: hypothetical protein OXN17_11860 [Candidatus Poribacteria bacterium]|nr:hypothetical protein [Candidatus Poribacteria bacterium]MDE0506770.1 hypothetical protein [Candidatus Poribacteria bacterium]
MSNESVQVSVASSGGGITEFRFIDRAVNPLNWEMGRESASNDEPCLRGHFLCLDRWGAPSAAEVENGMTFHGEAAYAPWRLVNREGFAGSHLEAEMVCELPIAQMTVRRLMRLENNQAVLVVRERITNTGKLGRIYNVVQHPSIAPPFLDPDTIVDSNAQYGFVQGSRVPESVAAADLWPNATIQGELVDLSRFQNDESGTPYSDVSTFIFDASSEYGWVTASSPNTGLLLGYLWRVEAYPWLAIWRARSNGRVAARGLEFGTTGLHQPYAELVRVGRILGRSLYEYIDANETLEKSYIAFLLKIPHDFQGVAEINNNDGILELIERRDPNPRVFSLEVGTQF